MRALALVLLLSGCLAPTRAAMVRREASARLGSCLQFQGRAGRQECLAESHNFCLTSGLEAGCGVDGLWSR